MKTIGIVCAMESEVQVLLKQFNCRLYDFPSVADLYLGNYGETTICIALSSIGKTNAAMATASLIENFDPEIILNVGVSGSLSSQAGIGHLIVGNMSCFHDQDISIYKDSAPYTLCFEPDPIYTGILAKCAYKSSDKVIEGTLATGDNFINTNEDRDRIAKDLGAVAVDMESASIAQVCNKCSKPFVVLRSISDNADDSEMKEYNENLKSSAELAQEALIRFIHIIGS